VAHSLLYTDYTLRGSTRARFDEDWEATVATILVLDAEADSRMLFKRLLEREGHEVIACEDRRDALDLAASSRLDLAIVNVDAGRRNTSPVGHMLREANSKLRILVITDFLHEERKEILADREVLIRPVELDTIEARVRELLTLGEGKAP
jgi:DNA-binding response OmpR family regulator